MTASGPAPTPNKPTPPVSQATPEQLAAAKEAEERLMKLMSQGDVNQANAATGLYGDSGVGKTSLAATAVEYCWTRFHKTSRYVAADLGGFGNKLLRLVRLGIAEVYNPSNHIEPFETMEDLSYGYWPEKIDDPLTGYAQPDVPLIPPQVTKWTVFCHNGHPVRSLMNKGSLQGFSVACPTCKVVTSMQNWSKVEEVTTRSAGHQNVGLWVFDSATALEDWALSDMASRAARSMDIAGNAEDRNALTKTGGRVTSGKYAFGTNQPAHYGFAQNRMPGWIKNSRTIPGIVVPPIFTFLELRASDDTGKGAMPIYGPKIAGSAKTSDVPSWLGNCLHISKEMNAKQQMAHRIWLVNHIDPGGIAPHLAKTRAEPGSLPPYLEDQEDEPAFTRFSLGHFFDRLEQVLHKGAEQDAVDFPDAPLFKPMEVKEDLVVSKRELSGRDISNQPMGRAPLIAAPPARPAVAAPAVTATSAPAKPAVAAVVAAPVVARPAAVPGAGLPAAGKSVVAAAPAAPVVAVVAGKPIVTTQPGQSPSPQPAKPAVAVVAPVAAAAPATPVATAAAAPATAAAAAPVVRPGAVPAVVAAPVPVVGQPTASLPTAVRPPAVPAMQNRPAGRPPAAPPPGKKP